MQSDCKHFYSGNKLNCVNCLWNEKERNGEAEGEKSWSRAHSMGWNSFWILFKHSIKCSNSSEIKYKHSVLWSVNSFQVHLEMSVHLCSAWNFALANIIMSLFLELICKIHKPMKLWNTEITFHECGWKWGGDTPWRSGSTHFNSFQFWMFSFLVKTNKKRI